MTCESCSIARVSPGYRVFEVPCVWCGARYMKSLKTFPPRLITTPEMADRMETRSEREEWRKHVLDTWVKWGHDRERLLEIFRADAVPLEPVDGADVIAPAAEPKPKRKRK